MKFAPKLLRRYGLLLLSLVGASTHAQTSIDAEAIKIIRAPMAVGQLGPDLFGDQVNFYNGSLAFVQTDVSLPGNSQLPVSVGRRLSTGSVGNLGQGLFAHWDLDIPSIQGNFSAQYGWTSVGTNGQPTTARCSNFGAPPEVFKPNTQFKYRAMEYWHGHMLSMPGGGSDEILRRDMAIPLKNTNVPTDGQATPLVTRGLWAIRCLGTLASSMAGTQANETGEGFLAISPDGTQYRFDWLVSRPMESVSKPVSHPYLTPEMASVSPSTGTAPALAAGPTEDDPTPQGDGC